MKFNAKWIWTLAAATFLAAGAFAQTPAPDALPAPGPGGHGPHGPGFGPGPWGMELLGFGELHGGKTVTGAPFTAIAVTESNRVLADGTRLTQKVTGNVYRDAQGRFRKEVTLPAFGPGSASAAPKSLVVIRDPVAGTGYILDANNKVAHALPQRPSPDGTGAGRPHGGPGSDANVTKESLGTQTVNGVAAEGTRYTRTIAAGQIGNDKPLTIVREEWYSSDLQVIVQSKRTDPFVGETTYTLTNIQRTAPNAALFTVPSDYTVKAGPAGGRRGFRQGGAAETPPPPPPADAPGLGLEL